MVYRTQIKIVTDILRITKDSGNGGEGVGISTLLRKGNISYGRLTRILNDLTRCGLIEEIAATRGSKYRISEQGLEFLNEYSRFEEFAQSFGLRL